MKDLPRNENWYSRIFARVYDPFMANIEKKVLYKKRKILLSDLRGKVLEVGAGTGINFGLYPKSVRVLAIEPSGQMLKKAAKRLPAGGHIELKLAGMGDEVLHDYIEPSSLDAVICTLVLCTIPDPQGALKDIYYWLKPGGSLRVIEHVRSGGKLKGRFQDFVNPAWKKFAEGCNLNRNTGVMISDAGFIADKVDHVNIGLAGIWGQYIKPASD